MSPASTATGSHAGLTQSLPLSNFEPARAQLRSRSNRTLGFRVQARGSYHHCKFAGSVKTNRSIPNLMVIVATASCADRCREIRFAPAISGMRCINRTLVECDFDQPCPPISMHKHRFHYKGNFRRLLHIEFGIEDKRRKSEEGPKRCTEKEQSRPVTQRRVQLRATLFTSKRCFRIFRTGRQLFAATRATGHFRRSYHSDFEPLFKFDGRRYSELRR